jgi:hypothetical protein
VEGTLYIGPKFTLQELVHKWSGLAIPLHKKNKIKKIKKRRRRRRIRDMVRI